MFSGFFSEDLKKGKLQHTAKECYIAEMPSIFPLEGICFHLPQTRKRSVQPICYYTRKTFFRK